MSQNRFFSQEEKEQLLINQEFMCGECGDDLWGDHIGRNPAHHILPVWAGGATVLENGVILCHECHLLWDNRAVVGFYYPEHTLYDIEDEQIYDMDKFFKAFENTYKNKRKNLKIK